MANRPNWRFVALSALAFAIAGTSLSCEDSVGLESAPKVASVSDLASCAAENAGEAVFVEDERMLYTCGEEGWKAELEPAEYERDCGTDVASNDSVSKCGADGTFTDSRDGRVYKCVKIGDQVWMAENLDFGEIVHSTTNQTKASAAHAQKHCYNNDSTNCAKYGGLYQWHTAMGLCAEYQTNDAQKAIRAPHHRGICPAGWHVPMQNEWERLAEFVQSPDSNDAGRKLKSKKGWDGFSKYTPVGAIGRFACRDDGWERMAKISNDAKYCRDDEGGTDSAWVVHIAPPAIEDYVAPQALGQNGQDEYGWNALPSGYYLYAQSHEYMGPHVGTVHYWKGQFVADEAFFWSTGQDGNDAIGYGVSAYPEYAGKAIFLCGAVRDSLTAFGYTCNGEATPPKELSAAPLFADPVDYDISMTYSTMSGDKRSARSVRCVQD